MSKPLAILALSALWTLSGCQTASLASFGEGVGANDVPTLGYLPNEELLANGKLQFKAGNYGKSYALFAKSTEVYPQSPAAWLGLAASADRIGRFDTADTAYRTLAALIPERPEYYNNVGYSYLLRGDVQSAQRYFLKRYEMDPDNVVVLNNLQLLRNSPSLAEQG